MFSCEIDGYLGYGRETIKHHFCHSEQKSGRRSIQVERFLERIKIKTKKKESTRFCNNSKKRPSKEKLNPVNNIFFLHPLLSLSPYLEHSIFISPTLLRSLSLTHTPTYSLIHTHTRKLSLSVTRAHALTRSLLLSEFSDPILRR